MMRAYSLLAVIAVGGVTLHTGVVQQHDMFENQGRGRVVQRDNSWTVPSHKSSLVTMMCENISSKSPCSFELSRIFTVLHAQF